MADGEYMKLACATCVTPFFKLAGQSGRPKKYCSDYCRTRASYGRKGLTSLPKARPDAATCAKCAASFAPRQWNDRLCKSCKPDRASTVECSTCRKLFASKSKRETRRCAECRETAKRSAKTREQLSAEARAASRWRYTCEGCGKNEYGDPGGKRFKLGLPKRFCTRACQKQNAERLRALLPKKAQVSSYFAGYCSDCSCAIGGSRYKARCDECKRVNNLRQITERAQVAHKAAGKVTRCGCGAEWCSLFGQRMLVCRDCTEAKLRAHRHAWKAARRTIEKAASKPIDPISVLEADGWRCYLCGCDTPRHLRGTYDDNAPEVEHVEPASKSKRHERDNLRCACRACNILKGDMSEAEFRARYLGQTITSGGVGALISDRL